VYSPLTEKIEPMAAEIGWRGSIISVKGLYYYRIRSCANCNAISTILEPANMT
jgi:hypothetical protein